MNNRPRSLKDTGCSYSPERIIKCNEMKILIKTTLYLHTLTINNLLCTLLFTISALILPFFPYLRRRWLGEC